VTALAYNIQGGVSDIVIPETINPLDPVKRSLGEKQYELSIHLGNMLLTVSDRKLAEGTEGSTAMGYRAEVLFASDYYPFGMLEQSGDPDWSKAERHGQMPGRQFSQEEYRYGFQGQETDKEWLGGAVSFKYRVHDARIGRFLSVDPLAANYLHNSPYAFSENRVVDGVELEGLEFVPFQPYAPPSAGGGAGQMTAFGMPTYVGPLSNGKTTIHTVSFREVNEQSFEPILSIMRVNVKVSWQEASEGSQFNLRNGDTVTLDTFGFYENEDKRGLEGSYTGANVKVDYSNSDGRESAFLQSINGNTSRIYDASEGNDPFYFHDYLTEGKFSDGPAFSGEMNTEREFHSSLVIYEQNGDVFHAVGEFLYSFTVSFDEDGNGSVSNTQIKFRDLSVE
jgi:RHS repeat-associated protein